MALQRLLHKGESSRFVPGSRDVAFEDLAFLIDGSLQVHHLAVQLHVHLIEVPPPKPKAAHAANPLAADLAGEEWAKSVPPQPHCLMAKVVAPLEKLVLDVPQRQRKADIEHHDFADQRG